MTKLFRDALIDELQRTGWSLRYVATEAGVSYDQLKKVVQGRSKSTNVDDALRVAHVFGVSLDEFLADTSVRDREVVAELWQQLSEAEREILLSAAEGRAARARGESP